MEYFNESKRLAIKKYLQTVNRLSCLIPIFDYNTKSGAYWIFGLRVDNRDKFVRFMKERGIATGVHYMPQSCQPLFSQFNGDTEVSEKVWKKLVTLPLYPEISLDDVDFVCNALVNFDSLTH